MMREDAIAGAGNTYDFGARLLSSLYGSWFSIDPLAGKYPSFSPYVAMGNNPISFVDPDGRDIMVYYNGEQVKYMNGQLITKDGTLYADGKYKGFFAKVTSALEIIRTSQEGAGMIKELESSKNTFIIQEANKSSFKEDNKLTAYAKQWQTDTDLAESYQMYMEEGISLSGGSGGTVNWNPEGVPLFELGGKLSTRPYIDLAHELFHGLDANRGLLDSRGQNGLVLKEWQAVYRENILRSELQIPLRTHYTKEFNRTTNTFRPLPPYMLDDNNQPARPMGYEK